jgi:large subunit ribosomal protein L10
MRRSLRVGRENSSIVYPRRDMDNPRPEKVAIVEELKGRFKSAQAVLVTEYRGLKVTDLEEIRRKLRDTGGEYKVFKNTLVRIAADQSGLAELDQLLVGPTGLTFVSGDVAEVAKSLRDLSKAKPALVIKGGVLSGKPIGAQAALALADLPSRDALLSQIAGVMAAPMRDFAGLLKALPQNFAYALSALVEKKSQDEAA